MCQLRASGASLNEDSTRHLPRQSEPSSFDLHNAGFANAAEPQTAILTQAHRRKKFPVCLRKIRAPHDRALLRPKIGQRQSPAAALRL